MKYNFFIRIAIAVLILLPIAVSGVELYSPGPVGTRLGITDFGVVDYWSVGNGPVAWWMDYATLFFEFNGGAPVEIGLNSELWNGIDPAPPVGGGFFHPGRYEDFSHDLLSPDVWSAVLDYQDPANNVSLICGIGYKLLDPSPILGVPYVEWRPYLQLTNAGNEDLEMNMLLYERSTPISFTGYANHCSPGYYWVCDRDGIDGTSDDFAVLMQLVSGPLFAYFFPGYPPAGYRIQADGDPGLYEEIQGGMAGYTLVNSTAAVGIASSELAWQYDFETIAPGEAIMLFLYPKVIRVDNTTLLNMDYDQINITAADINVERSFSDTDVSVKFTGLTYVQNPLVSWTTNTHTQVTVAEMMGGMVEGGIVDDLVNISSNRYWEIFADTRCGDFSADITFHYNPETDGIEDEADLLLAFRETADDDWIEYGNIILDEANDLITAVGVNGYGQWALGSSGNNSFQPEYGTVQFMTALTLPPTPYSPAIDTFDVSAWIPEGETWTITTFQAIFPYNELQSVMDALENMSVDIPLGFNQGYPYAKVWVELNINQNATWIPPFGPLTWPNNMYFAPVGVQPVWINVDFYAYLYDEMGDSLEYGTEVNPFIAPLFVRFEAGNMQPFVEEFPGYNPSMGTFFNYVSVTGVPVSTGIIPDPIMDWQYNLWHFSQFVGGFNNGTLTQTTITTADGQAGEESAYLTWLTQTEYNSDYFNIYRDGEVIATVPAAGTSGDPLNYGYLDENLLAGIGYYYDIAVVMLDDSEEFYPESFLITPLPAASYLPVVTISIDGDNIVLNWNEVAGISAYVVHRSDEPYFSPTMATQRSTIYGLSYTDDSALTGSSKYFYQVIPIQTD